MLRARHHPLKHVLLGGLLALLGSLFAPAHVQAGCGDHVLGLQPGKPGNHLDQLLAAPLEQPRPCTGPLCSEKPLDLPDAPPTPTRRVVGNDELSLPHLTTGDEDPGVAFLFHLPLSLPTPLGPDVSRPPR